MKILYVALKYNYGNSLSGYSFEHYNFYDTFVNMDGGSHEVIYFAYDEIMAQKGREVMNHELERTVERERPDVTFFILFADEFDKEIVTGISRSGNTKTVAWMTDDHWRFDTYSRYWASCFNYVVTTDSEAVAKYHAIGYHNVIKSQWACNHFLYKPQNSVAYEHGISFVGQPHGSRKAVIKKMNRAGLSVDCFGFGWPNGKISQDQMIGVFQTSKINLNLGNSMYGMNMVGIGHIFMKKLGNVNTGYKNRKSLRYYASLFLKGEIAFLPIKDIWANLKMFLTGQREQIKGRNFEVPGCGGFLLTSNADNLSTYYEPGKEIVAFSDVSDLIKKAAFYLSHDVEREAIAKAGYERTLRDHTYEQRFREIFAKMAIL